MEEIKKAVISLSGGLDSSCLLMTLLAQGKEVRAYSFNYGQKHAVELKKVKKNIKMLQEKGYPVSHQIINVEDIFSGNTSSLVKSTGIDIPKGYYAEDNMKSTVVPLRNVIFSAIVYSKAINWAVECGEKVEITLGLHTGDHCFTSDTKILTPEGLKTIDKLKVGDKVYSFNGDTLKIEEDKCLDVIEKGTNDTIYHITTTTGDIRLTSNHKVYVVERTNFSSKGYDKVFTHKLAGDLKEGDLMITSDTLPNAKAGADTHKKIYIGDAVRNTIKNLFPEKNYKYEEQDGKGYIVCPTGKSTVAYDSYMDAKPFLELMAWYITEGWTSRRHLNDPAASRFMSCFSQSMYKNIENCESIKDIHESLRIPMSMSSTKEMVGDMPKEVTYQFNSIISVLMQSAGSYSNDKCIPEWIMDFLLKNKEYIPDFINVMVAGDGHFDKFSGMYSYTTKSHQLAEDMAALIKLAGTYVKTYKSKGLFILFFGSNYRKTGLVKFGDAAITQVTKIEIEHDEEKVYDISIEKNHNFFAGEFGNVLISNSIYPDCRPESQEACRHAFEISDENGDKVVYDAPFQNVDKAGVLKAGVEAMRSLGFEKTEIRKYLKNTHTCYDPNEKGESCGECGSCVERILAFDANRMKDPVRYQKPWKEVLEHARTLDEEHKAEQ